MKTCTIEDCERPAKSRGWCNMHWLRWRRHGDPLYEAVPPEAKPCSFEGCTKAARARGWCKTHWRRWRMHGDPTVVLKVGIDFQVKQVLCGVDGCGRPFHARGCCTKHYARLVKHGDPSIVGAIKGRPLQGDRPTSAAVHKALSRERGPARNHLCVTCGEPAREWSYNYEAAEVLVDARTGCPYSLDLDDYDPRCVPCHRRFDLGKR